MERYVKARGSDSLYSPLKGQSYHTVRKGSHSFKYKIGIHVALTGTPWTSTGHK